MDTGRLYRQEIRLSGHCAISHRPRVAYVLYVEGTNTVNVQICFFYQIRFLIRQYNSEFRQLFFSRFI